jgi:hypothetical protein
MTEPDLLRRSRTILHDLSRIAAERAQAEEGVASGQAVALTDLNRTIDETRSAMTARYESERTAAERTFQTAREREPVALQAEYERTEVEFFATRRKLSDDYAKARDKARETFQEARWTARTVYEAGKKEAKTTHEHLKESQETIAKAKRKLSRAQRLAADYLESCNQERVLDQVPDPLPIAPLSEDPFVDLNTQLDRAHESLNALRALRLPRWVLGPRLFLLMVLFALLAVAPAGLAFDFRWLPTALASAAVGLIVGGTLALILYFVARKKLRLAYAPILQAVADGRVARQRCKEWVRNTHQKLLLRMKMRKQQLDQELKAAQQKARTSFAGLNRQRSREARRLEQHYPPLLADIRQRRDNALRSAEENYQRSIAECESRYETDLQAVEQDHTRRSAEIRVLYETAWKDLAARWRTGVAAIRSAVTAVNEESTRLFPHWDEIVPSTGGDDYEFPDAVPSGLRFGSMTVPLAEVPQALPTDERLREGVPDQLTLPALLPFPNRGTLLFRAGGDGRAAAVQAIQAIMLRYLTALPPGKVRFTILDPVGLGENFAAFMHLADYDESLVASRIWSEAPHIEQRLADLTAHMEVVIQKYLRNQFQTIEEYNVHAGEVAEPFRVLVVANFPTNFSVDAARRLVSIAASGARCGVNCLISVDPKVAMPQGFALKDLEGTGTILSWKDGHFIWRDADFQDFPLALDLPPGDALATQIMNRVGTAARGVKRVEVPFTTVAPPVEQYWTQSSRDGIDVPLGRSGATRLQHLKLGQGTSQHVLIAGKTGSGKSTLLHALITNLALRYAPDEVELYLVDFKKGVEFKTYASGELPHARVVAIESEREFGLSVLQRLDAELKLRGDRFRDAGVQNLAGFRDHLRQANGTQPACPRILLIVDEFQELFVEDDKVAQEAALLLDRLVRQGRAFGIHVHLGSQTLSGAYTLARSTIDQMAVRIALQCSETDAYLILSKDNSAARLLSRPGEAIYNDANGLVEGNDVFQTVWLPDAERDHYLRDIRELASKRHYIKRQPTVVFEGNIPADVTKNAALHALLEAPAPAEAPRILRAWLGEAIAIKDPTSAPFAAQSGANLLIVGPQEEEALGISIAALLGLAAQAPAARFFVLDGTPGDSPHAGILDQTGRVISHQVTVGGWREVPTVLGQVASEVESRQKTPHETHVPTFLVLFGLPRFRDLRRSEDDFSYGRRGEEKAATPSQQLGTILKEGPGLGIHTIIWCDGLNNLNRSFDRAGLREFGMRVLFPMSAADSSTLIDNPAASKLGVHRALFHSEDSSEPEKFRPYGVPSEEWLASVRERFGKHETSAASPRGVSH